MTGVYGLEGLAERTTETIAEQKGAFVPGIGRVETAEVIGQELIEGEPEKRKKGLAKVRARFVLISKAVA